MEKYDLIIVGAGPAGIFTAVELLRHGSKKKMLLVEKGKPVEKRHCPKAEVGHCVNCRPTCAITTGFSGAGAFSDGKLSLSYEVGGDLPPSSGRSLRRNSSTTPIKFIWSSAQTPMWRASTPVRTSRRSAKTPSMRV